MVGIFVEDVHPWTLLYSCILAFTAGVDVFIRKGQALRQAASGIERLILRDDARQSFIDASGFLTGYILGLPCYCYKPDVIEALKMLEEYPTSLTAYQQPAVTRLMNSNRQQAMRDETAQKRFDRVLADMKSKVLPLSIKDTNNEIVASSKQLQSNRVEEDRAAVSKETQLLNSGRVLVWLMAPVAAEVMRYGKFRFFRSIILSLYSDYSFACLHASFTGQSVMSDPRR